MTSAARVHTLCSLQSNCPSFLLPPQLPVLPIVLPKVFKPVVTSTAPATFPYGNCDAAFNSSCISIDGPTIKNYTGYQTMSLVISSVCASPLPSVCAENVEKIELNSCE